MKKYLSLFVSLLFLQSCVFQENAKNQINEKSCDFKGVFEVSCKQIELPAVIDVVNWCLNDSLLFCQSDNTENIFYAFSLIDFSLVESFGTKGMGPKEWLYPQMALSKNEKMILDDGKRKLSYIENQDIVKSVPYKGLDIPSDFKIYSYPLIGYMNFNPREVSWKLYDIETNQVKDSILYVDETNKGMALQLHEFFWDFGRDNTVVLASLYKDQYTVAKIQEDSIAQSLVYKGDGSSICETFNGSSTSKLFYGDVECSEDYIFLLSHKHQSRSEGIGSTEVEMYDYSGNPICLIKLDIYAQNMLLDIPRKRLLLLTPGDDYVYIADLSNMY